MTDTTKSETPPNPQSCNALGINPKKLNEGTCKQGKLELVVVNKGSTLKLDQLNAKLVDISTAETLQGRSFGTKSAKGTFVIARLAITNTTSSPKTFDSSGDVVGLFLCGDRYSEDFNVENGSATDSFVWRSKDIQPNTTFTGTAVFDVPSDRVDCVDKNGNLDLGNFRDDYSFGKPKQVGIIRTYH